MDEPDADDVVDAQPLVDGEDDPAPHPAAAAVNWRTVLVADASVGVAILLVGLAIWAWWNVVVGAGIASLGFLYLATVVRRGRLWRAWRHRNGLA